MTASRADSRGSSGTSTSRLYLLFCVSQCAESRKEVIFFCVNTRIFTMASLMRQSCLSAFRAPLATRNAAGVSQVVAFHASAKKQILPPEPRECTRIDCCFVGSLKIWRISWAKPEMMRVLRMMLTNCNIESIQGTRTLNLHTYPREPGICNLKEGEIEYLNRISG